MSFLNKVKQAFGFDGEGELDDDVRSGAQPYINPFRKDSATTLPDGKEVSDGELHAMTTALGLPENMQAELKEIKARMSQMMTMLQKQSAQLTAAKQQDAKEQKNENNDLKEKLKVAENQRRVAQEKTNKILVELEQAKTKATTLENDNKGLLNRIRVMELKAGTKGEAEKALEKATEQHRTELAKRDEQIKQLQQQLTQLQQQLKQVQTAGDTAKAELDKLKPSLAEKEKTVTQLTAELKEANANLKIAAEVQQKLDEVDKFKQRKNEEIAALRKQIETAAEQAREEVRKHDERHRQAAEEIEHLNKTIDQLNLQAKETADMQKRRDIDVGNHVDSLKQQLASATSRLERQQADRQQIDQELKRLVAEHTASKEALEQAQTQLESVTAQAEQMTSRVENLTKQVDNLTQRLAAEIARNAATEAASDTSPVDINADSRQLSLFDPDAEQAN